MNKTKLLIFSLLSISFQLNSMDEQKTKKLREKGYTIENRNSDILFLRNKKGNKVGEIEFNRQPSCHISWISTEERNKGLGSWLMKEAMHRMQLDGCQKAILYSVHDAQGFYKKIGFTQDPSLENCGALIPMSRSLKDWKKL